MILRLLISMLTILPTVVFAEALRTDIAMSPEERKNTGIDSLSSDKKAAFEAWLGTFTSKVIRQAPTYHEGNSLETWINGWPDFLRPNSKASQKEKDQERKEVNQVVFRVYDDKQQLELQNGSLWSIAAPDYPIVQYWDRGDVIEAKKTNAIFPQWILFNITQQNQAGATKIREATATGAREADTTNYFTGSVSLQSCTTWGEQITLQDNTRWDISPVQQNLVAKWKPNERIRYTKNSPDVMYDHTITNLDRGITVYGKKITK